MALTTFVEKISLMFLEKIGSIASVLPNQDNPFLALMQAHTALRAHAADRALTFAEKGISSLEKQPARPTTQVLPGQYLDSLGAALTAVKAVALRRLGSNTVGAQEAYQAASAAFSCVLGMFSSLEVKVLYPT
jgi:hypothetical protein